MCIYIHISNIYIRNMYMFMSLLHVHIYVFDNQNGIYTYILHPSTEKICSSSLSRAHADLHLQ